MDTIWSWGLDVIYIFQGLSTPLLDTVFTLFTSLGDEQFLVIFLAVMYWCLDRPLSIRLSIMYLLSSCGCEALKNVITHPRPFHLDPALQMHDVTQTSYDMPSNHAQSGAVLWGLLACWAKRVWVWVAIIILVILIGVSRVYLGLHFPTSVLVGWLVGGGILALYCIYGARLERWLDQAPLALLLALAMGGPLLLILLFPTTDMLAVAGLLMGLGTSMALTQRLLPYRTAGPWWQRALRFLVGIIPLMILYIGLKVLFPEEGEPLYAIARMVRYGTIALWAGLGAPWLFLRMGLAEPDKE